MELLPYAGWLAGVAALVGGALLLRAWWQPGRHAGDERRLRQMTERGVDVRRPQWVEFMLFVRTEPSARYLAERLSEDGYEAAFEAGKLEHSARRGAPVATDEGFLVTGVMSLALDAISLSDRRRKFSALAARENGVYLGWAPVKPPDTVTGRAEPREDETD